jgi:hypothetical protein
MPDIPYIRPLGRRAYVSIPKHMKNTKNNHSKWLTIPIEQQTFDSADYGNHVAIDNPNGPWADDSGDFWGFRPDFSYVGTVNQQFGFFVNPNNPVLPWHGYPIVPFSNKKYRISEGLLARWVNEEIIDEDDIVDIIRQKKIK